VVYNDVDADWATGYEVSFSFQSHGLKADENRLITMIQVSDADEEDEAKVAKLLTVCASPFTLDMC